MRRRRQGRGRGRRAADAPAAAAAAIEADASAEAKAGAKATPRRAWRRPRPRRRRRRARGRGVADAGAALAAPAEAKAEAKAHGGGADAKRDGGAAHKLKIVMPALEQHLQLHGCRAYAEAAIEIVMAHSLSDVTSFGCDDLCAHVINCLGFSEDEVDKYAELFSENGVDGWVLTEIDDADEYVEIGVKREHAVVFAAPCRRCAAGTAPRARAREAAIHIPPHLLSLSHIAFLNPRPLPRARARGALSPPRAQLRRADGGRRDATRPRARPRPSATSGSARR